MWNFSHNHEKENLSKQNEDDQMVFFSSYPIYIAEPAPNKEMLIPHGDNEKKYHQSWR